MVYAQTLDGLNSSGAGGWSGVQTRRASLPPTETSRRTSLDET